MKINPLVFLFITMMAAALGYCIRSAGDDARNGVAAGVRMVNVCTYERGLDRDQCANALAFAIYGKSADDAAATGGGVSAK